MFNLLNNNFGYCPTCERRHAAEGLCPLKETRELIEAFERNVPEGYSGYLTTWLNSAVREVLEDELEEALIKVFEKVNSYEYQEDEI